MNLESQKTTVNKSQKALFEYLTNLENFKEILPDSLEEFSVSEDSFKFALKGMPAIRLAISETIPYSLVKLKATSHKLPVILYCKIESLGENQAHTQLFFEGEVNMMMAMMIKKPLQSLLDTLSEKMGDL